MNANARETALLEAAALKSVAVDEMSDRIPVEASFDPDPANHALYDELSGDFVAGYRRDRRRHQQRAGVVPVAHWRRVANKH